MTEARTACEFDWCVALRVAGSASYVVYRAHPNLRPAVGPARRLAAPPYVAPRLVVSPWDDRPTHWTGAYR